MSAVMRAAGVLAVVLLSAVVVDQDVLSQAGTRQPVPVPAELPTRTDFSGLWRYNEEFSRDVATGRPERGPGGVPTRRLAPVERPAPIEPAAAASELVAASPFAPSPRAIREHRDMVRDLMEIAETLEFVVTAESVTITDDLGRSRTYPTDNREYRYRLGASAFDARVSWDDSRLQRRIEGTFGFRMNETYFLSEDGDRLFIIMRVNELARGRPPVGADRVYDRVRPEQP
jgi:hypothetical protein